MSADADHTRRTRSLNTGRMTNYPSVLEPFPLMLSVVVAVFGAIIGIHLITTLGISANTSVIGALVAILVARVPLSQMRRFRCVHRQNLLQTTISGATFGAGNALLLPIAIPWALGRPDLVWPMLIGAFCGLMVDAYVMYRVFDSDLFPGRGLWPPGVAAAETLIAGDKGGWRAWLLASAGVVGVGGAAIGIPMSALGVAFIGNIWALSMFGAGLLVRGFAEPVAGVTIDSLYIPHGVMIGAGLVALVQIGILLSRKAKESGSGGATGKGTAPPGIPPEIAAGPPPTTGARRFAGGLRNGFGLFLLSAVLVAVVMGLWAEMTPLQFVAWILFAAVAAMVSEFIIGLAAMQAGWFPATATALIFLVLGMLTGFPEVPLAALVAFTASTGPAFADMGYDLKTGWILRRNDRAGADIEGQGRLQQYLAEMVGFSVSLLVVAIAWRAYFEQDLLPPVVRVYAATITAGVADPAIAVNLLLWAIPGGLVQLIGGPSRQIGILFATGLLINFPIAGFTVLAGIAIRLVILRIWKEQAGTPIAILGAGFIGGDAVFGFSGMFRTGGP